MTRHDKPSEVLAWPLLDEHFRSGKDYTFDEYATFMSGFERIEANRIRDSGRHNYFEVTLTYVPPVVGHLTFGLRCECPPLFANHLDVSK